MGRGPKGDSGRHSIVHGEVDAVHHLSPACGSISVVGWRHVIGMDALIYSCSKRNSALVL